MLRTARRIFRWFAPWPRFCGLLAALFLARAAFVLSILPPFEGWDEYQHLAYIAFLAETGRAPMLGDGSKVPRSLYPELVRYPHGELAMTQVGAIGARSYKTFWTDPTPPTVLPDAPGIFLYQAQHAPMYYRLVTPIYTWLTHGGGVLGAVTALRWVNVLFGVGALLVALVSIGRLVGEGPHRYLLALLIALQPLFLLNCTRVANDALAVFLGTTAIAALLVLRPRRFWVGTAVGGVALGLAILAKASNLSLLPFAGFVFVWQAWPGRIGAKRSLLGCGLLLAIVLTLTASYFRSNLLRFGVLTPMQEAIQNHEAGKGLPDMLQAAWGIDWLSLFVQRFLRHSLWFGGWSWLRLPPDLTGIYQIELCLAILGGLLSLVPTFRRQSRLAVEPGCSQCLGVMLLSVILGLAYHAIHTRIALGIVATNSWYAAVAFPWLLVLYYQGIAVYPGKWTASVLAIGLALTQIAAELYGTIGIMVPAYAQAGWGSLARARLAELHLPGLGPHLTIPSLVLMLVLVSFSIGIWLSCAKRAAKTGP